jgi:hypothetical protein
MAQAYNPQDLGLVLEIPTSSNARVNQDVGLAITSPTSSKARVLHDLQIVVLTKPLQTVVFINL